MIDGAGGRSQDERWIAVDQVIESSLLGSDAVLDSALMRSRDAGLPAIHVAPPQGKFLYLLAKAIMARSVLEIGTLGGYSTICLARALPAGGSLISLELDPAHAVVAIANIAEARLSYVAEVRVGPAAESLAALKHERRDPFDLVFIDADKPSTSTYFDAAVTLTRQGGVIIVDNVVRDGGLAEVGNSDPNVVAMQRFVQELSNDARVEATAIQTVGSKGYDGFVMTVVR